MSPTLASASRHDVSTSYNYTVGLDAATGKRYIRSRRLFWGYERFVEKFAPDGTLLCRYEHDGDGRFRIVKGSLWAVQAVCYGHAPDEFIASIESNLTDREFDCMAGVDLDAVDEMRANQESLAISHGATPV